MPDTQTDNEKHPSLSDAISAVMADPSIIQSALEALKKSGIGGAQSEPPPAPKTEAVSEGQESTTVSASHTGDASELIRTLSPMLSMLSSPPTQSQSESKGADRRSALLVALRPYLSESRREAIDYIIKISQVSDLIKKAGR